MLTNEDTFYYHKYDKLDPSKVEYNKYCIQRFDNKVYTHFDFFFVLVTRFISIPMQNSRLNLGLESN